LTGIFWAANRLLVAMGDDRFAPLQVNLGLNAAFKLGIAGMSGFLFAVTYRYIVRNDDNSHLKDGAVLAFGIIRCLALLEGNPRWQEEIYAAIVLSGESILGFALVRLCLDWIIAKGWLKQ
jgi:hypothetical protein